MEIRRVVRNRQQEKSVAEGKLVESANLLTAKEFFGQYSPKDCLNIGQFEVVCETSDTLPKEILEECLSLIEETSADDYRNSEMKWSKPKKRKEMVLPDMKYIVLLERETDNTSKSNSTVSGFISFMITYEDGYEVVYIYEIHFSTAWQGKGIGKQLMNIVETIAANVAVGKAMLTVFKANDRAVKWYNGLGYSKDEFSPGPKRLRNGIVKEPTYVILSKSLAKD